MAHLCKLQLALGLLLMAALASPAGATVYVVGGPAGWTTPVRAKVDYTAWAASTPFKVGDSLVFNYVYKAHTVLEVTRSDFRYCNKTNPIASFSDPSGSTTVNLTNPGSYYFIDGVDDHCEQGQKFQAKVTGPPAPAPAPAPSPETTTQVSEPVASPSLSPAKPPMSSPASPPPLCPASLLLLLLLAIAPLSLLS